MQRVRKKTYSASGSAETSADSHAPRPASRDASDGKSRSAGVSSSSHENAMS